MPTPTFYTKRNDLTDYALSCGYVQTRTAKDGSEVRLTKDISGTFYTVRHVGTNWSHHFHTLTAARIRFRRIGNTVLSR